MWLQCLSNDSGHFTPLLIMVERNNSGIRGIVTLFTANTVVKFYSLTSGNISFFLPVYDLLFRPLFLFFIIE